MSDESQPPPLRLKPRSRPADSGPDAPPAPEAPRPEKPPASASPSETGDAAPRLRLKPKLSLPAEEAAPPEPSPPPPEKAGTPAASDVPPPAPPPAPDTTALLRPKLRLATPSDPAPAPVAPPAAPPASVPEPYSGPQPADSPPARDQPPGAPPPEAPSETPPAPAAPAIDPSKFPPPPKIKPAPQVTGSGESLARPPGARPPTEALPENRPMFKMALLVMTVAAVGVLAAGFYFAYTTFVAPDEGMPAPVAANAGPEPAPKAPAASTSAPSSTSARQEEPQAVKRPTSGIAGRVRQTTDAAAARVAEIPLDGPEPAARKSPAASVQQQSDVAPTPPPPSVADVAPPPSPPRMDQPDPAFQLWVSEARVSGVRRGAEARAFINGRLVRQGEIVDPQLGVRFEGIDASQNILLFRDPSGAVIGKKF